MDSEKKNLNKKINHLKKKKSQPFLKLSFKVHRLDQITL